MVKCLLTPSMLLAVMTNIIAAQQSIITAQGQSTVFVNNQIYRFFPTDPNFCSLDVSEPWNTNSPAFSTHYVEVYYQDTVFAWPAEDNQSLYYVSVNSSAVSVYESYELFAEYDTISETFSPLPSNCSLVNSLQLSRLGNSLAFSNGTAYIWGGYLSSTFVVADVFASLNISDWKPLSTFGQTPIIRYYHSATMLPDGRMIIIGGVYFNDTTPVSMLEIPVFNTNNLTWIVIYAKGITPLSHLRHCAALASDNVSIIITGGLIRNITKNTLLTNILNTKNWVWASLEVTGVAPTTTDAICYSSEMINGQMIIFNDNDSNSDSNCGMTKISILDTRNGTYTWSQNFEPSNVLSNITFPIGNTPHSDNIIIGIAAEILVLILIAAILFIKSRLRQNVSASSPELEGVASETSLLEAREFTKHLEGELQTFTESMGEDASQNTFSPEPEQRDSTEIMEGGDSSKILTEIMEKDDSRTGSSAEPMELQTSLEIMKGLLSQCTSNDSLKEKLKKKFPNDEKELCEFLLKFEIDKLADYLVWIPYDKFSNLEEIGKGGFSIVYKAIVNKNRENETLVALKEMTSNLDNQLRDELIINAYLQHNGDFLRFATPPVIGLSFNNSHYILVMDYAKGGNLEDILLKHPPNSWQHVWQIAEGITERLQIIHRLNLIHSDLHPGNIVFIGDVTSTNPIIIDVGICKTVELSSKCGNGVYGRPKYLPPEHFEKKAKPFSQKFDIYCLGTLLWQLTSRCEPRGTADSPPKDAVAIGLREVPIPGTPEAYKNIYTECWNSDPDRRPTVDDVLKNLLLIETEIPNAKWLNEIPEAVAYLEKLKAENLEEPEAEDDDGPSSPETSTTTVNRS